VRLAPDLAAKINATRLDTAFDEERARLQEEIGLPFPGIAMWTSSQLPDGAFQVLLFDVPHALAPDEPTEVVPSADAPERDIATRTIALLRRHAHLFLGIQETQWVLDQLGIEYPGLVAEVQKALQLQRIADVLRRLLEEQVSIRNTRSIMESLVTWGPKEKDMLMLTEYVRCDLSRLIAHRATGGTGRLRAIMPDQEVEQVIRQSIKQTPTGNFLALPPEDISHLVSQVTGLVGQTPQENVALVASMDIRRYLRRMLEVPIGWLPVYSYQELTDRVELEPFGRLTL
jgi:type III secretion protein V